ncbi:mitochondrial ATP-independent inner membrane protease subunit 2-like [Tasmannia lanceolata]|uniref:mitochondrial ATP-independent inner membrane protease subunit 2-like n=1 Tax=Tasmannia lanceolata TaxID=3420 RepID=UPI004063C526
MVPPMTWFRYIGQKLEYSLSVTHERNTVGQIWKNVIQDKLTAYLNLNRAEKMAPTIIEQGRTLLVRKLPFADPFHVFVGDVVVLRDPEYFGKYLIRTLAAVEGHEMASTDKKDTPFILENDQCWVVSTNDTLKPKKARDSRTFGPVSMTGIVGRVIYSFQTAVEHGCVVNSDFAMQYDHPVLAVELDVDEMARFHKT